MAERQALGDPIGIGMMHFFASAEITATSCTLALQKMAFTGAHAHDFTASGDFEPFRYRFFGLNAFWASHKIISFRPKWGCQKSGEYRVLVSDLQVLLCKGRLSAFYHRNRPRPSPRRRAGSEFNLGAASIPLLGLTRMFIDEVKVYARAGHGGKGCVAFLRETFRPKGGPSGGNGGGGGKFFFAGDHAPKNPGKKFFTPQFLAEKGEAGMGKGMDGHAGKDLIIRVPCGTLVWKLRDTTPSNDPKANKEDDEDEEAEDTAKKPMGFMSSTSGRPVLRHAGANVAVELD